jgi:hypothetical protein
MKYVTATMGQYPFGIPSNANAETVAATPQAGVKSRVTCFCRAAAICINSGMLNLSV